MEIDFELFGDITDAETIAFAHSIRDCANCANALEPDGGESGKVLPMCASAMVRYGLRKYIGTKPMVLVK